MRSIANLLLADILFCVQQEIESASPKKDFCANNVAKRIFRKKACDVQIFPVACFLNFHVRWQARADLDLKFAYKCFNFRKFPETVSRNFQEIYLFLLDFEEILQFKSTKNEQCIMKHTFSDPEKKFSDSWN